MINGIYFVLTKHCLIVCFTCDLFEVCFLVCSFEDHFIQNITNNRSRQLKNNWTRLMCHFMCKWSLVYIERKQHRVAWICKIRSMSDITLCTWIVWSILSLLENHFWSTEQFMTNNVESAYLCKVLLDEFYRLIFSHLPNSKPEQKGYASNDAHVKWDYLPMNK